MKTCLIIQPGKLGDIIISAPIAKYYHDNGYNIVWPTFSNFKGIINRLPYVQHLDFGLGLEKKFYYSNKKRFQFWDSGKSYNELKFSNTSVQTSIEYFKNINRIIDSYDLVIDGCVGFPGSWTPEKQKKNEEFSDSGRNWIDLRYHLSEVPLSERWNFSYQRNLKQEKKLLKFIQEYSTKKYGNKKYSIVHSYNMNNKSFKYEIENPIHFSYVSGFEITDWRMVLENSIKIVCADSSLANYVEVLPSLKNIEKIYLGSEELHFHDYMRNILKNNWINLTDTDITYSDYLNVK